MMLYLNKQKQTNNSHLHHHWIIMIMMEAVVIIARFRARPYRLTTTKYINNRQQTKMTVHVQFSFFCSSRKIVPLFIVMLFYVHRRHYTSAAVAIFIIIIHKHRQLPSLCWQLMGARFFLPSSYRTCGDVNCFYPNYLAEKKKMAGWWKQATMLMLNVRTLHTYAQDCTCSLASMHIIIPLDNIVLLVMLRCFFKLKISGLYYYCIRQRKQSLDNRNGQHRFRNQNMCIFFSFFLFF